jgi:uncharacterized protein (DUF2147 family)
MMKSGLHQRFIAMRCFRTVGLTRVAKLGVFCLAGLASASLPAFADPREVGVWFNDEGDGAVKIEVCTPTTLCGKIYWLKQPMADDGHPKVDRFNPEPGMRKRPICGLTVMRDLVKIDNGFDNGSIYNPKDGKSYDVALDLVSADKLKVTGYKGMRFLGKSFIWTRAPADLPACNDQATLSPVPAPVPAVRKKHSLSANGAAPSKLGAADAYTAKKKKTVKAATQPPPIASN